MPVAVVLGARNLGGAVARHLADRDWAVAAVARSQATLDALPEAITGLTADATEPAELDRVLGEVAERLGGLDLVVNAVSASRPPAPPACGRSRTPPRRSCARRGSTSRC